MEQKAELKKKLEGLIDPHQLELFGKTLNSGQVLDLLDIMQESDLSFSEKLSPILAGVSHENFFKTLALISQEQLVLLQHESMTVPVQHHLTQLIDDKIKVFESIATLCLSLEMMIDHCNVEQLTVDDLNDLLHKIHHLEKTANVEILILGNALSLAWNSNRIDLIEKLSTLRESLQKYKMLSIGSSETSEGSIFKTGLYAKLQTKLDKVYEGIDVNVPAIEGLVKLSILHIPDYLEVGLLPDQSKETIALDPEKYSDKERLEHRDKLLVEVKKQLDDLGLLTLKDLKEAKIYSKDALREYISGEAIKGLQ